jgi:hypothetical protein
MKAVEATIGMASRVMSRSAMSMLRTIEIGADRLWA